MPDPISAEVAAVTLEQIEDQRERGWPDFHPEDFCHACGRPNICWFTSSPEWNRATAELAWGKGSILCPVCFVAEWEKATGLPSCWELTMSVPTASRLVSEGAVRHASYSRHDDGPEGAHHA